MFSRAAFAALLVIALSVAGPVSAQIEDESMDDLNAWGQRLLASGEKEFPTSLWRGSDDEKLLALLQSVRAADLSPAERALLRRAVLSPATAPDGENAEALLAERVRLMLELGEARAAAALAPQLKQDPRGLDGETLAVDLDLASGREASACAALAGPIKEGTYWVKLRAVCAVLQDNFAGAQLAIEMAGAQDVNDDWMIAAIFAASGDSPEPPKARFDSGLNIALSTKAGLDPSTLTLAADRPDLAAAIARREDVPLKLRARFAEIASAFNLISGDEHRDILLEGLANLELEAASQIEQVLQDLNDPLIDDETRLLGLNTALQNAARSDLSTFRSVSDLFLTDLRALPQNALSAEYGLQFARAAMIAGDRELAQSWLATRDIEGVSQPDPYQIAVLEAVDILAGGEASLASLRAIEKRLVATAESTPREIQTVRILTSWTGIGLPLTPVGRDFVASVVDRGERIPQGQMTSLKAATNGGAFGEAVMSMLSMTNGDAKQLAPSDFATLLDILIDMDAPEIASDLAIEASNFWKDPD
ncbi:MAG: hypothetical protein AAFY82_06365 [Pseudomonadota bacterium]